MAAEPAVAQDPGDTLRPRRVHTQMKPPILTRQLFFDSRAPAAAQQRARMLLKLLLVQDGSTTRICEAQAGEPPQLHVQRQGLAAQPAAIVRTTLPGDRFLERHSSLSAHGQVMMDNLVYVALERIPGDLHSGLEGGAAPIGHLLQTLFVQRIALQDSMAGELFERLWSQSGMPDPSASRAYTIATADGPLFLIAETYRRGMLMESAAGRRPGSAPATGSGGTDV